VIRRREFITLLGGVAAAWPVVAQAQQPPMPVIGSLYSVSATAWADNMAGMRRGLSETGFVDGRNAAIEYRWADGQPDRMRAMAADLIARKVTVILAGAATRAFGKSLPQRRPFRSFSLALLILSQPGLSLVWLVPAAMLPG
jgi:putative tryptophan/tyrosine transport system substrate-binding protein